MADHTPTTPTNTEPTIQQQEQQPNANPAVTGENKGRMFTQDDVNRIVSERLAREREKTAPTPPEPSAEELRMAEISATENRIRCKEFILDNKQYPPELLDLYDTKDFDAFKASAVKLLKTFPQLDKSKPIPTFAGPTPGTDRAKNDPIAAVFRKNRV